MFSDIFSELALSHVNQIAEQGSPIVQILLQLLQLPESNFSSQTQFWKELFRTLSKINRPEVKQAKFQIFESTVLTLLQIILKRSKLAEHLFLELNKTPVKDTCFDEVQKLRRDASSLIKSICHCCGPSTIFAFFS